MMGCFYLSPSNTNNSNSYWFGREWACNRAWATVATVSCCFTDTTGRVLYPGICLSFPTWAEACSTWACWRQSGRWQSFLWCHRAISSLSVSFTLHWLPDVTLFTKSHICTSQTPFYEGHQCYKPLSSSPFFRTIYGCLWQVHNQ